MTAPRAVPAQTQLELLRLPRVWVAGFVSPSEAGLDIGGETARLLRQQLESVHPAGVVAAAAVPLASEAVFGDRTYWRRLGEEHGSPLIVTGSVRLLLAPARQVQRGRRSTYVHATGRVLDATVILIDGRTGEVIGSKGLPRRTRYADRFSSPRILYYELMDAAAADWLTAIATATHGHGAGAAGGE